MQRILLFATISAYCIAMNPHFIPMTIQYSNAQHKRIQFNWLSQYERNNVPALKEEISRQMNVNQLISKDYFMNPTQQYLSYFDVNQQKYVPLLDDHPLPTQLISSHNTLYLDNWYTNFHVVSPDGKEGYFWVRIESRQIYNIAGVKGSIANILGWNIDWTSHKLWFDLDKLELNDDTQNLAAVTKYVPNVYLTIKRKEELIQTSPPSVTPKISERSHTFASRPITDPDETRIAESSDTSRQSRRRRSTRGRRNRDAEIDVELQELLKDKDDTKGKLLGFEYKYWVIGGIILVICIIVAVLICVLV